MLKRITFKKKKITSGEERDSFGERKWFWKRQYDGASLMRGQGLAAKDTLPTGKKKKIEERDLLQWPRIPE